MKTQNKQWRELSAEDCPDCGWYVEVFTTADVGYMYDGDRVRCAECGSTGVISACEDDASIIWDDEWSSLPADDTTDAKGEQR